MEIHDVGDFRQPNADVQKSSFALAVRGEAVPTIPIGSSILPQSSGNDLKRVSMMNVPSGIPNSESISSNIP
jgi:hypothetical protein